MYLRVVYAFLLTITFIHSSTCENNDTTENKPKRNIYHIGDGLQYLPVHHLTRFAQVRTLAPVDPSQVDITYKPGEPVSAEKIQEEPQYPPPPYQISDSIRLSSDNNQIKVNGHLYQAQSQQQQNMPHLNGNQHVPHFNLVQNNQRAFSDPHQLNIPHNQLLAPHYPLTVHSRLSAPYTLYGGDKNIALPSANIRTAAEIKLPNDFSESYTTIPVIYGQPSGNLPSLKYIQPTPHGQYSVPANFNSLPVQNVPHSAHQLYPQHLKYPAKLQAHPHRQHRLLHPNNQQHTPNHSPLFQINENYKSIHPQFYQPQVFDNPVVTQIQHYLPQVKNPFDMFTRPVTSAPLAVSRPTTPVPAPSHSPQPPPKQQNNDDDSEDEDDERHVKEEIQGEVIHEEINDEDKFEDAYRDSARGFPAYKDHNERDEEHNRYNHDDEAGRHYGNYRTRHYDDDDDDHHVYNREPQHYHDDDRPSRHYHEADHEAHFSQKNNRHESKDSRDDHPKNPRPSKYHESKKYYKHEDPERRPSKRPSYSAKYYKSSQSSPRKHHGDARHAASAPKKQNTKAKTTHKSAASSRSEVESSKPNYQYGFEPIPSPYTRGNKPKNNEDSEAKHSSPASTKKVYKENWYISKTSET